MWNQTQSGCGSKHCTCMKRPPVCRRSRRAGTGPGSFLIVEEEWGSFWTSERYGGHLFFLFIPSHCAKFSSESYFQMFRISRLVRPFCRTECKLVCILHWLFTRLPKKWLEQGWSLNSEHVVHFLDIIWFVVLGRRITIMRIQNDYVASWCPYTTWRVSGKEQNRPQRIQLCSSSLLLL